MVKSNGEVKDIFKNLCKPKGKNNILANLFQNISNKIKKFLNRNNVKLLPVDTHPNTSGMQAIEEQKNEFLNDLHVDTKPLSQNLQEQSQDDKEFIKQQGTSDGPTVTDSVPDQDIDD